MSLTMFKMFVLVVSTLIALSVSLVFDLDLFKVLTTMTFVVTMNLYSTYLLAGMLVKQLGETSDKSRDS